MTIRKIPLIEPEWSRAPLIEPEWRTAPLIEPEWETMSEFGRVMVAGPGSAGPEVQTLW